jgi:methylmalonyl-CoA mutase
MPLRFVTAASLFDGHDASINIMRRLLQRHGAEVAPGTTARSTKWWRRSSRTPTGSRRLHRAGTSSTGYFVDRLHDEGYGHVKVYGGGGGVIVPSEIEALRVRRRLASSPGRRPPSRLDGMAASMLEGSDVALESRPSPSMAATARARAITPGDGCRRRPAEVGSDVPVLGITGTGGSGKSSDGRAAEPAPSRPGGQAASPSSPSIPTEKGGGALLGDRIRMNSIGFERLLQVARARSSRWRCRRPSAV